MHGANEAREGHLLEFVVDEVTDGIGEGEAGRSGRQCGPVYVDGHLHCLWYFGGGEQEWVWGVCRRLRAYLRWRISGNGAFRLRRRQFLCAWLLL